MRSVTIGDVTLSLTDDQVADLRAQLAVDFVSSGDGLLTTEQAAKQLGFSPDYVRDHAHEFGGRKLTAGPRAPWRFPRTIGDVEAPPPDPAEIPQRRRRSPRRAETGQLLKSRG